MCWSVFTCVRVQRFHSADPVQCPYARALSEVENKWTLISSSHLRVFACVLLICLWADHKQSNQWALGINKCRRDSILGPAIPSIHDLPATSWEYSELLVNYGFYKRLLRWTCLRAGDRTARKLVCWSCKPSHLIVREWFGNSSRPSAGSLQATTREQSLSNTAIIWL